MDKTKARILVVDDEPRDVWMIKASLESKGYTVLTAGDGHSAVELAGNESPDLILLDIRLPDVSGYEVCRQVREFSTAPIIMLSALGEDEDKIKGLDVGADDYMTKPFSAGELMARVRAALRRSTITEGQASPSVLQAGNLHIDLVQQRVFLGEREINLTPTEYQVLCELARYPGRVLVMDYLAEKVWGMEARADYTMLRQVIHRLRRKIEPDPQSPQYIQTRPGAGYVLTPPE